MPALPLLKPEAHEQDASAGKTEKEVEKTGSFFKEKYKLNKIKFSPISENVFEEDSQKEGDSNEKEVYVPYQYEELVGTGQTPKFFAHWEGRVGRFRQYLDQSRAALQKNEELLRVHAAKFSSLLSTLDLTAEYYRNIDAEVARTAAAQEKI